MNDTTYEKIKVNYLPSGFIPYPKDTTVYYRDITLGESESIGMLRSRPAEIIRLFKEREIISGIDVFELTYDDWQFLELTVSAASYPDLKFTLDGGTCPKCGHEVRIFEIILGDQIQKVEKRGKLHCLILPERLSYYSLDDDVEMPIEVALTNQTCNVDFYRVKHHIDWLEGDKKISYNRHRIESMLNISYDELSLKDEPTLAYLLDKLGHGPQTSFDLTCDNDKCRHVYPTTTRWEVAAFIPFLDDRTEENTGNRVRFGARTTPTNTASAKSRFSSRPMALSPSSGAKDGEDAE